MNMSTRHAKEGAGTARKDGAVVTLREVTKRFRRADGQVVSAVDAVSLAVDAAEFLVLLGPSGCGKTTLLRSIAGLERPDGGVIEIGGRTVFGPGLNMPPERRGISMVFQSYALWPHLTVHDNVAYPLRNRRAARVPKTEITTRVRAALDLVGIGELARQYPGELSGGQQQRIALARAFVAGDGLVLFDEPLSNIDAKVRERLRADLLAMQRRLGFAAVYVTHDQTEAMELATRVAVLRGGHIEQIGPPREIYERPASRYVADFVGLANEVPGTVTHIDGEFAVLDSPLGRTVGVAADGLAPGQKAVAIWRPEAGRLGTQEPTSDNHWRAERRTSTFAGPHHEHRLTTHGLAWRVWTSGDATGTESDEVWVSVAPERTRILPA
ncbi:ABC transporter ATP-binding protein [Actinomadura nitritigenes]|uniref:ABC transporter ATP-binding protein n=1 Tax=Actinomadura nitritigenes TaxID=134602 RepID=UPI003D8C6800